MARGFIFHPDLLGALQEKTGRQSFPSGPHQGRNTSGEWWTSGKTQENNYSPGFQKKRSCQDQQPAWQVSLSGSVVKAIIDYIDKDTFGFNSLLCVFSLLPLTGIGFKEGFSASLPPSEKSTAPLPSAYPKRKITVFKYPHFPPFLPSGLLFLIDT